MSAEQTETLEVVERIARDAREFLPFVPADQAEERYRGVAVAIMNTLDPKGLLVFNRRRPPNVRLGNDPTVHAQLGNERFAAEFARAMIPLCLTVHSRASLRRVATSDPVDCPHCLDQSSLDAELAEAARVMYREPA